MKEKDIRIVICEGERLDLVVLITARHFWNCLRWINDKTVTKNLMIGRFPCTLPKEEKWFKHMLESESDIVFAIEFKDGTHIGNIGLHDKIGDWRRAEIGTIIGAVKEWGKGYGTEAKRMIVDYGFNIVGAHKITSLVFSDNKANQRVNEKIGFKKEGVLREHLFNNGKYIDVLPMAILKNEWEQMSNK